MCLFLGKFWEEFWPIRPAKGEDAIGLAVTHCKLRNPEVWGSRFLRNVGKTVLGCVRPDKRRPCDWDRLRTAAVSLTPLLWPASRGVWTGTGRCTNWIFIVTVKSPTAIAFHHSEHRVLCLLAALWNQWRLDIPVHREISFWRGGGGGGGGLHFQRGADQD